MGWTRRNARTERDTWAPSNCWTMMKVLLLAASLFSCSSAFSVHAPVARRAGAVAVRQVPAVAVAEWVGPATEAALGVVTFAGVTVFVSTAVVLAGSAEFMVPMTVGRMPRGMPPRRAKTDVRPADIHLGLTPERLPAEYSFDI